MPATTSLWPPRYLVAEWTTTAGAVLERAAQVAARPRCCRPPGARRRRADLGPGPAGRRRSSSGWRSSRRRWRGWSVRAARTAAGSPTSTKLTSMPKRGAMWSAASRCRRTGRAGRPRGRRGRPATAAWSRSAPMPEAKASPRPPPSRSATRRLQLGRGRVLVAGVDEALPGPSRVWRSARRRRTRTSRSARWGCDRALVGRRRPHALHGARGQGPRLVHQLTSSAEEPRQVDEREELAEARVGADVLARRSRARGPRSAGAGRRRPSRRAPAPGRCRSAARCRP